MLISFFLLSIISKTGNYCIGNNTKMNWRGQCVCVNDFPFGDPESEYGCFNCNDICHIHANCVYPGICQCMKPYKGDGMLNCSVELPHIISVSPSIGSTDGGTNVSIQFSYRESLENKTGYCKFGPLTVKAEAIVNDTIICITPPHQRAFAFLSISFDTIAWSKDKVFFSFKNTENVFPKKSRENGFYIALMICLSLLGMLYYALFHHGKIKNLPYALNKFANKRRIAPSTEIIV